MAGPIHAGGYWQTPPMARAQLTLFVESLESRIPADHPVRLLDEILDRLDWRDWEAEYHGRRGQPPIPPSVLCKVLLFAMLRRVRSSRQIEYQLRHSIDFLWLASGRSIDHVTLCQFRRQHPERIKAIYGQLVRLAVALGLAKLSDLCIDGTRVLANASRRNTWTAASLTQAIAELDATLDQALRETEANDAADDLLDDGQPADQLPAARAEPSRRRELLHQALQTLERMEAARTAKGRGRTPARLPKSDPDGHLAPSKEGGVAPNYTPMAVVETGCGLIVGADLATDHVEHTRLVPMVEAVASTYGTPVATVTADSLYATGENLRGCAGRALALIAPLPEASDPAHPARRDDPRQPVAADQVERLPLNPQTKRFDKSAFLYDEAEDCYFCPMGRRLTRTKTKTVTRSGRPVRVLHYTCRDCVGCPLADRCRLNPRSKTGRDLSHDEYEETRRRHRETMKSPEFQARYRRRAHFAETPFAMIKSGLGLRRSLLRGVARVRSEWHWACAAFNVQRLMTRLGPHTAKAEVATASSAV